MEAYGVILLTSFLVGFFCAVLARRKGKDPMLWFIVGVVLNIIALGIIASMRKRGETDA